MKTSWKHFVKMADMSDGQLRLAYGIGGAAAGGALGWFYDKLRGKKSTLRRVLTGSAIGWLSGFGGAHLHKLLRDRIIKNRMHPNDPKKALDDMRTLWSYQRNYAYRNRALADTMDDMGDGTRIGKNGFVLSSPIWRRRIGSDKFDEAVDASEFSEGVRRVTSRLAIKDVIDQSGTKDKMSKVLVSVPAIPGDKNTSIVSLVGPVNLHNVFSFEKEWPVYQLRGTKDVMDLLLGLKPETLQNLKKRLDTGDLSKFVLKRHNGLYWPSEDIK